MQQPVPVFRKSILARTLAFALLLLVSIAPALAQSGGAYQLTNIISDGYVPATVTDKGFVDPWGISIGRDFWIDTAVTGFSYVNVADGTISFKATIPPASGTGVGQPTGTVFNSTTGFVLSNGAPANFLFGSLDGVITGWNGGLFSTGNVALVAINNSAANAVYTDIALDNNGTSTFLLAANFGKGAAVEIYDQNFKPATLAGSFTDPNVPAGYAPYAIHPIGGKIYVTYMLRSTSTYIETLGTNTGFIDVYDVNGNFLQRAITGGNLNAPWGMALAPATFGIYGGDLLVGNLGDGLINVYDPATFAYLGQIIDGTGSPILASLPTGSTATSGGGTSPYAASTTTSGYTGLWEIVFGTGTSTSTPSSSLVGDSNTLYFAAGLASETHGLFGSIAPSASATGTPGFGLSTSTQVVPVTAGQSDAITVSVEPVNGFSGTVSLACSGLPAGATCSFSPATVTASATSTATTQLTIQTASQSALSKALSVFGSHSTSISSAMLLPLGAFALFGRRRRAMANYMRILGAATLLFVGITAVIGCGGNSASSTPTPTPNPGTPAGTSQVTITATAGSVSHATTISLAVQ